MATIVERPMSALSDGPPLPQQLRRPSIVEVIDVDLLEEAPSSVSVRPRPRPVGRPQPETIFLIDSDDDEPVASGSSNPRQRSVRSRLVTPPLRVSREPSQIPPVPRVPRRYSGLTSLPITRRPPSHPSPPVIRPIDQPFEFEANIQRTPPAAGPSTSHTHPNRHRRIPHADLQPEPRSHHVPTMGLGGALISFNRDNADRREQQRRQQQLQQTTRQERGFFQGAGNTLRRMYSAFTGGFRDDEDDYPAMQMFFAPEFGGGENDDDRFRGLALQELYFRTRERQHQRQQEVEYKAEFTHPGKPESGFTFDFAPPEPPTTTAKPPPIVIDLEAVDNELGPVPGPSSSTANPPSPTMSGSILLVCARCLDPLVLGGGLTGEDGRKKKVWALRCGHMIDGKCLDAIGAPEPQGGMTESDNVTHVLEQEPERPLRSRTDGKGKGKARAEEEQASAPVDNSIRSRLRSRGTVPSHPLPAIPLALSAPSAAATTSRLGKRKRPSSPAKPRIQATHEWKCPVASCGRTHASAKIDGAWVPEPENLPESAKGKGKSKAGLGDLEASTGGRGAIAVFV
ncbi:hypothetical protein Hypma_006282 [Hypsizygus marmoreus]|uniref:Uncharacterized protein n=1 Tax=Hypsizygus marmoreus TaxID=39966 RepID=A0A369K2Z8_HYPMA|nr:hypothetical protein Hypma_006282 [Hypsizygus marmoreus]